MRPYFKICATALALTLSSTALHAEIIHKTSPHSVVETMDRLEEAVTAAGATVFARVDHAAGAQKVDMELRPTQLLIFGNPVLGTPAMQDDIRAGIVLPLRVLVYQDEDGDTQIAYEDVTDMFADFDIDASAEYINKMRGALQMFADKAVD